jgi:hypothetical protein
MHIGYARVSTKHQNVQRQCAALKAAGCAINFTEKLSGKTTRNRPQLARALARLRAGDVFVVCCVGSRYKLDDGWPPSDDANPCQQSRCSTATAWT